MKPADLALLARIVELGAGLSLSTAAAYRIESRLAPLAAAAHPAGMDGLLAALRGEDGELQGAVTDALLDPHTVFFRDREVFRALRETVLPEQAERRGGAVRVWSAACGTGQEPYSLAMIAAGTPGLILDLCASDVSERALQKARAGAYTHFEVQRGLPVAELLRSFDKVEDAWRVKAELRAAVRWRSFNLLDDMAPLGRFDLILCRYVLAAMTSDARRRVLAGLARALARGGVLVLGADEALNELPDMIEAAPEGRGLFRLSERATNAA